MFHGSGKKPRSKELILRYKPRTAAGNELANIHLYRVQLSEKQVIQQLKSLKYEELSVFGNTKPIFSPKGAELLVSPLTKALNQSPENKIVYINLNTPRGATAAVVFPTKNALNWKFSSINGSSFPSESFINWRGRNWRLVKGRKQHYHSAKKLVGKERQENWIKMPIPKKSEKGLRVNQPSSPSSAKRKSRGIKRKPIQGKTPNVETDPNLEKKLQFLKELYEKNLVDEKEYNRKRKELLNT